MVSNLAKIKSQSSILVRPDLIRIRNDDESDPDTISEYTAGYVGDDPHEFDNRDIERIPNIYNGGINAFF